MTTIAELIETLEANNIPYYVSMREDWRGTQQWYIGIATHGGDVYHWFNFEYCADMDTPEAAAVTDMWTFETCHVEFTHRYNRNTGATCKGRNYRRAIVDAIRSNVWPKSMVKRGQVFDTVRRDAQGLISNSF